MNTWLLMIVMSLATYRLTRLLIKDTFPPVLWLRDRLAGGWRPLTEPEVRTLAVLPPEKANDLRKIVWQVDEKAENRYVYRAAWSPYWLAELVSCPWCASGWISMGVTAGTWGATGLPVPLLVWPAVWAAGALLAAQDWA